MSLFDRTPDRNERTPEERERARAEREARRAAREGRAPAEAPALPEPATASAQPAELTPGLEPVPEPAPVPVPEPEPAPAPEPVSEAAPESVPVPEPEPEPEPEPVSEPVRPPEAAPTPRRTHPEPVLQAHRLRRGDPVAPRPSQPARAATPSDPVLAGAGSGRRGSRVEEPAHGGWPAAGGHPDQTTNGGPNGGDRGRPWRPRLRPPREPDLPRPAGTGRVAFGRRRRVAAVIVGIVVLAIAWFLSSLFQPLHGGGHGAVEVRIPANVGVGKIGDTLTQRGVVSSSFFFSLRTRLSGQSADLKPGRYTLERDMSYGAAIAALVKGPQAPKTIDLTIPEGRSIYETAARLKAASIPLAGSYASAARRSSVLSPRSYGAPRSTATLEGFLWPATYNLAPGAPAAKLVDQQVAAFRRNFAGVDLRYARRKNLTAYDVITIASMVEGEARTERDRPLIAAVIYNRLRVGEPLAIDATIAYATHKIGQPLTRADTQRPSPYNTYLRKGLPPTPIGNPGLASLRAAAHPASVPYRYYVVNPRDLCRHVFTADYAAFLRAQAAYDKAATAGRVDTPKDCRAR